MAPGERWVYPFHASRSLLLRHAAPLWSSGAGAGGAGGASAPSTGGGPYALHARISCDQFELARGDLGFYISKEGYVFREADSLSAVASEAGN